MCGFALRDVDLCGGEMIAGGWWYRYELYVDMYMRSSTTEAFRNLVM